MKSNSITDFVLCASALILAVIVAVASATNMIETKTAFVFLSIAVAFMGMSLLDVTAPIKRVIHPESSKKSRKKRK